MNNNKAFTVMLQVLASIMVTVTWLVAILLLLSESLSAHVAAWIFLGGKGVMLAVTLLAMLRNRGVARQLFAARYRFDTSRPTHGVLQAVTRFTWELPQLWLGYVAAQLRNIALRIDRADTLGGVTYASCCSAKRHSLTGMSLSCFVNIWMPYSIQTEFAVFVRRYSDGRLFQHEYGHTIDSQIFGPLYLIVVGLPSLLSMMAEERNLFSHRHKDLYAERSANRKADRYFHTHA